MKNEQNYIDVLKSEVEMLTSRLEPHDMGHLHTAIYVLKHRIEELETDIDSAFVPSSNLV